MTNDEIQKYIDTLNKTKDETSATDQELQDRLAAMKAIGQGGISRQFDNQALSDQIRKSLRGSGLSENDINYAIGNAVKYLSQNPNLQAINDFRDIHGFQPIVDETRDAYQSDPELMKNLENINHSPDQIGQALNNTVKGILNNTLQAGTGQFFSQTDHPGYSEDDLKRVQDLINTRQTSAANEKQVGNYLGQLPDLLSANREQFLAGETKDAIDQYNQSYVPDALQNANARGTLFSGDVPDLLTSGAVNTQSQLDAERANMEQQDNQFYFNAAYSNQVRQVLNSNSNVQDYLTSERNRVLTGQQNQFQLAQQDRNNQFNQYLTQADYNRQLTAQQAQLQRQQDLNNRNRTAQLAGGIGSAVGTIGGAVAGGPVGAVVGSQVGNQFGQGIGEAVG